MRIPGSPEEVTSLEGPCTLHFLTDFYAYARFKLTPERFVNYCDKCFLSLPGHEKVTLEGEIERAILSCVLVTQCEAMFVVVILLCFVTYVMYSTNHKKLNVLSGTRRTRDVDGTGHQGVRLRPSYTRTC